MTDLYTQLSRIAFAEAEAKTELELAVCGMFKRMVERKLERKQKQTSEVMS